MLHRRENKAAPATAAHCYQPPAARNGVPTTAPVPNHSPVLEISLGEAL